MPTIRRWLVLFTLCLAALSACRMDDGRPGRATPAASAPRGPGSPTARHTALEVHAAFWLPVEGNREAADVARALGDFAQRHDGWVQTTALGDVRGSSEVTLRVPPASLGELRALLARHADADHPLRERTTSTDVTDALADLDARLRAARAAETRLLALLDQRTGTLADVLAAERALGEERTRIEQLESEQRAGQGRVDLATVDVTLEHGEALARASFGAQATSAARMGVRGARTIVLGCVLAALATGPTLAIILAVGLAVRAIARALGRRRG